MAAGKSDQDLLNFAVLALRGGNKSLEGIDWSEPLMQNNELAMKYAVMGLKNHVSYLIKIPSSKMVGYSWFKHTKLRQQLLPMTKPSCQRQIPTTTHGIGKYIPIFSATEAKPQVITHIPVCDKNKTLSKQMELIQHSWSNKTKWCQRSAAKTKIKHSVRDLSKTLRHQDTTISSGPATEINYTGKNSNSLVEIEVKSKNATKTSRETFEKRSVFWANKDPSEFNQLDILKSMYAVLSSFGGSIGLADSVLWRKLAEKLGYRNFIDVRKYFLQYIYPNLDVILEGNDEIHSKARNLIKTWCTIKYTINCDND